MRKGIIIPAVLVILVIIVVAGVLYSFHFASSVTQDQSQTASRPITLTTTPVTGPGLRTFQVVPAQTTASYSVYENLIIENEDHRRPAYPADRFTDARSLCAAQHPADRPVSLRHLRIGGHPWPAEQL